MKRPPTPVRTAVQKRLLLVGEAPSRTGDPTKPLTGRVGRRLAALAGLSTFQYLRRTERMNLLDRWPGSAGKGSAFPLVEARSAAWKKLSAFVGRRVVLVGRRVADALDLDDPYLGPWRCVVLDDGGNSPPASRAFLCAVIPHPSGVNRWWNDPKNTRSARAFLRSALSAPVRRAA